MNTALDDDVDEVAVARFLDGHQVTLTRAERIAVIAEGLRREMRWEDLDALFGNRPGAAQRLVLRLNAQARAEGREPVVALRPRSERALTPEQVVEVREAAAAGEQESALAGRHGLSRQSMRRLLAGVTYRDCGGPLLPEARRGRRVWALPEGPRWPVGWNSTTAFGRAA